MDFSFTETQSMLRDTLRRYLADAYDFDRRQAMLASPDKRDPGIWKALASEIGILGAPFAERHGGFGGGPVDSMVIMEELGRAIACEPYLSTVVVGGGALELAGGALADELIPAIIGGDVVIAFAWAERQARFNLASLRTRASADGAGWTLSGEKAVVIGAPYATHYLVTARTGGAEDEAAGVSLLLVPADAPGISRRDYPTVDGHLASELSFEMAKAGPQALIGEEGHALPLVQELFD
ncbi:MAG: acyl-CoA dehydrogenase family protein, partial [Thermaurantiacus sp.]